MHAWHKYYKSSVSAGAKDAQGRKQGWWADEGGFMTHYVDGEVSGPNGGKDAAVLCLNGLKEWHLNGLLHREDAPARTFDRPERGTSVHEYHIEDRNTKNVEIDSHGVVVNEWHYDEDGQTTCVVRNYVAEGAV